MPMWVRPRRMRDCWTDSQGQARRLAISQSPAFIHVEPVIFDHISHLIICLGEETLPSYSLRKHAEMIATTPSHLDPDNRDFYVIFLLFGFFFHFEQQSQACVNEFITPLNSNAPCVSRLPVWAEKASYFLSIKNTTNAICWR